MNSWGKLKLNLQPIVPPVGKDRKKGRRGGGGVKNRGQTREVDRQGMRK